MPHRSPPPRPPRKARAHQPRVRPCLRHSHRGLLSARLLGLIAAAALAIALAGLYGLLAFSVQQRHREFGVRMALGAGPHQILALVLRRATTLLAVGLAGGLMLALLAALLPARRAAALAPTVCLRE